jgi:hypothetical protein
MTQITGQVSGPNEVAVLWSNDDASDQAGQGVKGTSRGTTGRRGGTVLGDRKPALVLDRAGQGPRSPVAVVGKAWCLADARKTPIEVGDLLRTSDHPGHAIAPHEQAAAFGAVIGKASPLPNDRGPVLVLVGLA